MPFTGNEDQQITLAEATALTSNYRASAGTNPILAHYFGNAIINDILAQQGCVGIRIYYAVTATNEKQLVLVGVDSVGNDLYNGVLGDKSFKCPPTCAAANPLNS